MAGEKDNEARLVADIIRTLQKHLQCVICFETLRDPMTTRCGHTFCQVCIIRVVKGKNALCPLCNARINRRGVVENEKIRGVVQAVHVIISSAQKDIADMGCDDVLQLLKESTHSNTRQSLPPIEHDNLDQSSTSGDQKTVSKRSKKVESWLLDVHAPSASQVSIQSLQPVVVQQSNSPTNGDSDSEMESVSQINPDQTSRKKPLSAYIEDDCEPPSHVKKPLLQKSKTLLAPKRMGQLNVKAKQESLKGFGALKITPTKAGSKTSTGDPEMKVPDPVIVVLDLDKENTNSPGWSHVQNMKKDFQISPAPSIEDPGSSDELPCLNLSLDSPVLKKKNRVNEIVNSLQSEIEVCERSMLPVKKRSEKNLSLHSRNIKKRLVAPSCSGFSDHQTIVKFLKLGRLTTKKSPNVPFYLRGSLQHMRCKDVTRTPFRLLQDAQAQTESVLVRSPQMTKNKSFDNQGESPVHVSSIPMARRSLGAQSDVDMDAETLLLTQPLKPPVQESRAISPISLLNEATAISETEIIECTYPQNDVQFQTSDAFITGRDVAINLEKTCGTVHQDRKQSQDSKLSCGSLDVIGRSPKKKVTLEAASNDIPQVDLDDDSSSSVGPDISSKRPRPLGSFSDSSDSDVGVSKKQKQKKKKIQVLSDNENSCSSHNDDADISIVDTSKIMANIEARLAEEERMQSAGWLNEVVNSEPVNERFEDCLDVLSNTSKNQIDSDGDSEVINPTPQKQFSFTSRQTTQSDDIVPSSQPPIPTIPSHRLVPPLLGDNHKDSIGSKPNDLPQEDLLESLGNQRNTCEDIQIVENHASSQAPVTEDASESNLFSDPVEVTETRNGENAEDALKTTKLQFVCSSLPGNLVAQVEKLANIVKAEFSSKFTSDTSHLIVRVDESNRADKTLKYLCAVAAGKWVVSFAWVEKCIEAGKLLPEEPFEALDATGEPGPQRSRESRLSKKNLFSGFEFCCIGDFPDISKAQMQALLIDCGASMVSKPTEFSLQQRIIPVALAQWDESKEAEYNNWLEEYCTPLVQHEWVLDCIGKFSVTSFSAMLLCDVSEDYLASMGIPSYLFELTESEQ
ncbi:breast cancer type 1 susceptibility protein homolog [Thrips palmi]|uniref:Breast cancer type 1 susceptibility protein homolog n=1 Tax=Thrips palmi TaxID=161013 RepID=A0A6P9A0F6_THRPL|nr:breast cancer type 1 susceptibility protein homolog [Thrips palmi]